MSQHRERPKLRIPEWLRTPLPQGNHFPSTKGLLDDLHLNTVCQGAKCPNRWECYSKNVATFLIMGRNCTRNCRFCNISPGPLAPLEEDEPLRISEAVRRLSLQHVVITSVTRDDLDDGGASHFAACIARVRNDHPSCSIEVLIPDFEGNSGALQKVIDAGPDIINHNVETVPELYSAIRPQANYVQSLELLRRVKEVAPAMPTKSGLMVGLGETYSGIQQVIADMHAVGCTIITIGQYMRPTMEHPEVEYYMPPEEFDSLAVYGKSIGVPHMFCAPLVRSSYNAAVLMKKL